MDWKDALASLSGLPEGEEPAAPQQDTPDSPEQKSVLHVLIEKKGRGGKTATIVEGFDITDEEVDKIARDMRKRLGTGGSSRGGEILIQGDRRNDAAEFLRNMGFKVKGDFSK